MKKCDNSEIHISSNFLLSVCLLIMLDTFITRTITTLQHFATLHHTQPTTLHYTYLHFTSSHLHFTALSFGLTHIVVSEEVYILSHFNIILKHVISSTKMNTNQFMFYLRNAIFDPAQYEGTWRRGVMASFIQNVNTRWG
jgi:hypothetical protein